MTLDEFLDDYVPNVLRPLKGQWRGASIASIRIEWPNGQTSCPLTAAKKLPAGAFRQEGQELGLTRADIETIVCAADWCCPTGAAARARIQHGLGLQSGRE